MQFSRKEHCLLACCVSHPIDDCNAEEGAEDYDPAVAVFSLLLFLLLQCERNNFSQNLLFGFDLKKWFGIANI